MEVQCNSRVPFDFKKKSKACIVLDFYLFTSMYPYISVRSSLFIISCAKLLHKLVKFLYCELSFQITYILPNLSMSVVILKQLLHVFSSCLKFLASIKSWQQSLHFLENVLSIITLGVVFQFQYLTLPLLIFCSNIKSSLT